MVSFLEIVGGVSVTVPAIVVIGFIARMWRRHKMRSKSARKLLKPVWTKDRVYIVQFPPSPHIRTISPFSLKLESWLRLHNIDYECVYSLKFSRKGQIPYIELNGVHYPDSNQVIEYLTEYFNVNETALIADEEMGAASALAHALTVMLENHTCLIGFYFRYSHHMPEFYNKLVMPHYPQTRALRLFFRHLQPYAMRYKMSMSSLGRHSDDELASFCNQDLRAVDKLIGDKRYCSGDQLTSIDCTLFAHLVQFVYLPIDLPQKQFITSHCPRLIEYVDRVRDELWPDWNDQCNPDYILVQY